MKRLLLLTACVFCSLAVSTPAFAQSEQTYEDLLKRGSEALQEQDLETAVLLFSKAQQLHEHPRVRLSIAAIYEKLGECTAARANYLLLMDRGQLDDEVRELASKRFAAMTCGVAAVEVAPTEPEEPQVVEATTLAANARPARPSRAMRVFSVSMLTGGVTLTAAGALVASGVFIPPPVRRCHGLGATLDSQVAACGSLAASRDLEFWEAHVAARTEVERHRLVATTLLTGGLISSAVGIALLLDARSDRRQVEVGLGPSSLTVSLHF